MLLSVEPPFPLVQNRMIPTIRRRARLATSRQFNPNHSPTSCLKATPHANMFQLALWIMFLTTLTRVWASPQPTGNGSVHVDEDGNLHITSAANGRVFLNGVDVLDSMAALQQQLMAVNETCVLRTATHPRGAVLKVTGAGEELTNGYYKEDCPHNGKPHYVKVSQHCPSRLAHISFPSINLGLKRLMQTVLSSNQELQSVS